MASWLHITVISGSSTFSDGMNPDTVQVAVVVTDHRGNKKSYTRQLRYTKWGYRGYELKPDFPNRRIITYARDFMELCHDEATGRLAA